MAPETNPITEPDNEDSQRAFKARYVMIGGFLGAGKTTAIVRLAKWLSGRGLRAGLITNDQGSQLVDSAMMSAYGFPVEEIPGGCFCCRFNSLVEAANRLSEQTRPDVFLAEPVGSCTDLVATVSYPLRRIYGGNFAIAPLSVVVDPVRALRVFGCEPGGRFSDKVLYIYKKQLEEADIIVINKSDLLDEPRLAALRRALSDNYPGTRQFEVSARQGAGLEPWFEHIASAIQTQHRVMDLDYEAYAEGEARLGWLNGTIQLSALDAFDGNALLEEMAKSIQQRLNEAGAEVAHLKMTLDPEAGFGNLAVINLVRNDFVPELSQELIDPILSGQLIINIRAEAEAGLLRSAATQAANRCAERFPGLSANWEHLEFFQPAKPTPTYRVTGTDNSTG